MTTEQPTNIVFMDTFAHNFDPRLTVIGADDLIMTHSDGLVLESLDMVLISTAQKLGSNKITIITISATGNYQQDSTRMQEALVEIASRLDNVSVHGLLLCDGVYHEIEPTFVRAIANCNGGH